MPKRNMGAKSARLRHDRTHVWVSHTGIMNGMSKPVTFREIWSGAADCRQCALRSSVLFAGLTEQDFATIHDPIDHLALEPGVALYHVKEQGEFMFTIRSGTMKLVQYLADGSQRIVRLARATDVLGLEALISKGYQHDAIALQTTELCRFPTRTVQKLAEDNPSLHRELMIRWQQALNEADAWLTELSTGSARQRIARLLLRLVRDQDPPECQLFGREDMGAMLGITTETASRTIASFRREHLLVESRTNHFRLAIDRLRQIAED